MGLLDLLFGLQEAPLDLLLLLIVSFVFFHALGRQKRMVEPRPTLVRPRPAAPMTEPHLQMQGVPSPRPASEPYKVHAMTVVRHLLRLMGEAHARAHANQEVESLAPQMLHWMEQNKLPLQGRRLAMGVWGMAKLLQNPQDMEHRPFLVKLTELILRSADLFTLHGLTNISRAYASMCRSTKDEQLISMRLQILETMAARVPECMDEAVEQPVVNLIWSFAVSDIKLEDAPHCEQMLRCLANQLIEWGTVEATLAPRFRLQRQLVQLEGHPIVELLKNL